ncbi:MAG TPA: TIGR01906 family membrane protein [Peptococcaceae bacterium]|nr:TIGR01906 family membrane protein [Peptococcaceae bacterium]
MLAKRFGRSLLAFFSALILSAVLLLTAIEINAFDLDFFRSEYVKLNTAEAIGISEPELMQTTELLLAYIKGEQQDLRIKAVIKGVERQVFNQREIDHMVDVQRLYAVAHWLRNSGIVMLFLFLGLLLFLTGRKFWQFLARGYLAGATVFLLFLGAIALAISRDFLWFWNNFHYLIFTNDLWILNPETDILIQMVPEQFFLDLVVRIIISFGLALLGLAALAGFYLYRKSKNSYKNIKV